MAEWLKAAVLKTVFRQRNVGSNPTPSAESFVISIYSGEVAEWLKAAAC